MGSVDNPTQAAGILITRGVTASFPPGTLSNKLRQDGTHEMEAKLHLHYDVLSYLAGVGPWASDARRGRTQSSAVNVEP